MSTNKKKTYLMDEFSQGTYGNLLNLTGEYASPVISKEASVPNNTGMQVYTGNSNAYQGGTVYLDMQNPTNESVLNPNIYGNYLKDGEPVEGSGEEKVTTAPMTYAEYIESQKGELEKQRKEAERQAEIYAQRARANAQASYMQNMSTYGINAETLAQMGLTGGGYSDYLNAQAYAQKQNAINTANANELTAKQQAQATYADNINKLEASAFEQRNTTYNSLLGMALDKTSGLTDEYIKAMANSAGLSQDEIDTIINTNNETQAKYSDEQYTALMLDLGNVNTYGNYTEDSIRTIAKQWGWDEERTQKLLDTFKATNEQAEIALESATGEVYKTNFIKAIQNGDFVHEDTNEPFTEYEVDVELAKQVNNGVITNDEKTEIMQEYQKWYKAMKNGVSQADYLNAVNGDQAALDKIADMEAIASDDSTVKETAKSLLKTLVENTEYEKGSLSSTNKNIFINNISVAIDKGNVVDTRKANTTFKDFGDYRTNQAQKDYLDAILDGISEEDKGKIVIPNYGSRGLSAYNDYFIYLGNGIFVGIDVLEIGTNYSDFIKLLKQNLYIPDGYEMKDNGKIKEI